MFVADQLEEEYVVQALETDWTNRWQAQQQFSKSAGIVRPGYAGIFLQGGINLLSQHGDLLDAFEASHVGIKENDGSTHRKISSIENRKLRFTSFNFSVKAKTSDICKITSVPFKNSRRIMEHKWYVHRHTDTHILQAKSGVWIKEYILLEMALLNSVSAELT